MEVEDGSQHGSKTAEGLGFGIQNECVQEDGRNSLFYFDFFSSDNGVELVNPVLETPFNAGGASKPDLSLALGNRFGPFFYDLDLSLKLANSVSAPLGLAPCVGNKNEGAGFTQRDDVFLQNNGLCVFELCQSIQFECINNGTGGYTFEVDGLEGLHGQAKGMYFDHPEAQQLQRFVRKETDEVSRDASQSTPVAATSCTESSVCDNFGGEILTERVETTIEDMHEISWYGSAEQDALSKAGDVKSGKEQVIAALTVNRRKYCKQRVNVNSGALDLLVSAIQATSGLIAEEGNDHYAEKRETDIHNLLSFVHKKRVLRRARSKFNKFSIMEKMGKEDKLNTVEQTAGLSSCQKARQEKAEELEAKTKVKGILEDGETLIRSRRGRCLTLPTKFSDSVIHLWNRKSRRAS